MAELAKGGIKTFMGWEVFFTDNDKGIHPYDFRKAIIILNAKPLFSLVSKEISERIMLFVENEHESVATGVLVCESEEELILVRGYLDPDTYWICDPAFVSVDRDSHYNLNRKEEIPKSKLYEAGDT